MYVAVASCNSFSCFIHVLSQDDGSGTVTILEAFRSLVDNGFEPERTVEFHWYSAEEAGLYGSQDVAKAYNEQGKEIVAMVQNDMTGYVGAHGEVFGIATDYVNEKVHVLDENDYMLYVPNTHFEPFLGHKLHQETG